MAIATLPFGRLGHQSTRTLFGAAALGSVSQDDADRTLDVLLHYGVAGLVTVVLALEHLLLLDGT